MPARPVPRPPTQASSWPSRRVAGPRTSAPSKEGESATDADADTGSAAGAATAVAEPPAAETVVDAPPWDDAAPTDLAADVPPAVSDAAPFESTAEAEGSSPAFEEDRPSDDRPSDDRPFGSPGI